MSLPKNDDDLMAEMARKHADISADFAAIIGGGGGNLPEWEMLETKHAALSADFEQMRQRHAAMEPEMHNLPESKSEPKKPLFRLGWVRRTDGAVEAFDETDEHPSGFLERHQFGDWSEMSADDQESNRAAVEQGSRVFSAYYLKDKTKIWIITEADRTSTTILLPDEY